MTNAGRQNATDSQDLNLQELQAAREQHDLPRAMQCARHLLRTESSPRTFRLLRRTAESWPADDPRIVNLKVGLLSSFSIEFLQDAFAAYAFASGIRIDIYQPSFGTFRQEILDPDSGLYSFAPNTVILAVEGDDWCPDAYRCFVSAELAQRRATVPALHSELKGLLATFRSRSPASVLIHNLAQPPLAGLGVADWANELPQRQLVAELNEAIAATARSVSTSYVVDYAGLVGALGANQWYDRRMALYARVPISAQAFGPLAAEWTKCLRGLSGLAKKCLVLDLDNTLWGGVVGEDGISGIRLGQDYPGNAFVAFQQSILDLRKRGVILAVASKNNPADVDEVFANHESMLLKREHFSAWRVSWSPKPDSLREIAASLDIGLDHLVFADDSPFECDIVRQSLPAVTVLALPRQPERYVDALLADGWFDALTISKEDLRRTELYRQRAAAEKLKTRFAAVEDYLRDLDMELTFRIVDAASIARAAQLTQKTNQFNVTTRRYTEADLSARLSDFSWIVAVVASRDRLGDNGIVGLMMAQLNRDVLDIDTLLLSCRVIGRTIETAMLSWLCNRARESGASTVVGRVIPSPKNTPARMVYSAHGFSVRDESPSGTTTWELPLGTQGVRMPDWFRIRET